MSKNVLPNTGTIADMDRIAEIVDGGTGARRASKAVENLNGVSIDLLNKPLGVAGQDKFGYVPVDVFPLTVLTSPTITGPTSLLPNIVGTYTITNFDSFTTYDVKAVSGTVSISGKTITYTAPDSVVDAGFVINKHLVVVTIISPTGTVKTPSILTPINNTTGLGTVINFTTTSFQILNGTDTHLYSDWQIATDNAFATIVAQATASTTDKIAWSVNSLMLNRTYFVRVRHRALSIGNSAWSPAYSINTIPIVIPSINKPVISIVGPSDQADFKPIFTSSAYVMVNGTNAHQYSLWTIKKVDANNTLIAYSNWVSSPELTRWQNGVTLEPDTEYVATVTYKNTAGLTSTESSPVTFRTKKALAVLKPTVLAPLAGAQGVSVAPVFTSNAFATQGGTDIHQSSDWQVATDPTFANNIFQGAHYKATSGDIVNKTSWNIGGLNQNTVYYVRVRYNGTTSGASAWSDSVAFTTGSAPTVNTPAITFPLNNALDVITTPTFTGNAFATTPPGYTHQSSDWQVSLDPFFISIVASVSQSTTNLTSYTVPSALANNTVFYVRCRYLANMLDFYSSAYSPTITFKTVAAAPTVVTKPTVTYPVNGATNVPRGITLVTTSFATTGTPGVHMSTDWRISTTPDFLNITNQSLNNVTNKTALSVEVGFGTTYYLQVRFNTSTNVSSPWSDTVTWTTMPAYGVMTAPVITAPVNNATNVGANVTFIATQFTVSIGTDTLISSDWTLQRIYLGYPFFVTGTSDDTVNKTSWSVTGLDPNTTYRVSVKQRGAIAGVTPTSEAVTFTTAANFNINGTLSVFPNGECIHYQASREVDLLVGFLGRAIRTIVRNGNILSVGSLLLQDYNTDGAQTPTKIAIALSGDGSTMAICNARRSEYGLGNDTDYPSNAEIIQVYKRSAVTWTEVGRITVTGTNQSVGDTMALTNDGSALVYQHYIYYPTNQTYNTSTRFAFITSNSVTAVNTRVEGAYLQNGEDGRGAYLFENSMTFSGNNQTAFVTRQYIDPDLQIFTGEKEIMVFNREANLWAYSHCITIPGLYRWSFTSPTYKQQFGARAQAPYMVCNSDATRIAVLEEYTNVRAVHLHILSRVSTSATTWSKVTINNIQIGSKRWMYMDGNSDLTRIIVSYTPLGGGAVLYPINAGSIDVFRLIGTTWSKTQTINGTYGWAALNETGTVIVCEDNSTSVYNDGGRATGLKVLG